MRRKTISAVMAAALSLMVVTVSAKPNLVPSVERPEDADKTVVIKDTTKAINVFENEIVLFKVGSSQFAIKFDGVQNLYDLSTLAPPGVLTRKVKIYVSPDMRDHGQNHS